jgi:hypothetical protein
MVLRGLGKKLSPAAKKINKEITTKVEIVFIDGD